VSETVQRWKRFENRHQISAMLQNRWRHCIFTTTNCLPEASVWRRTRHMSRARNQEALHKGSFAQATIEWT